MRVINFLRPSKVNGVHVPVGGADCLLVRSVWNSDDVALAFQQGDRETEYIVRADELKKAIDNVTNRPFSGRE